MIRSGQTIENSVTGEVLVFHETSRDTGGEYAGEGQARFTCEVRPAMAFEQLIETMFGLAADGKTSKKGMPNPLRLAVIAPHHFDDVRLPLIPHLLQRAALALGAPIGKAFGYSAVYEAA